MAIAFVAIGAITLNAQIWQKIDGTNPYINRIFSPNGEPNRIIVSSDADSTDLIAKTVTFPYIGSGCQASNDSGTTFDTYFLTGNVVYDLYQSKLNNDFWLAAVRKFDRGGVLHSTDKGATWTEFLTCDGVSQLYKLSSTVLEGKEFFVAGAIATNEGMMYSDNAFVSCETNTGLSIEARDIAYSNVNPNLMFVAGDNYSFGKVLRSYDKGATWLKDENGLQGLRILSLLASSVDPSIVLCGADSVTSDKSSIGKGVYMSLDTGKTWARVGGAGAQVFEIVEHPRFPRFVAAAAGLQGVLVSSVYGQWFESYNTGLPEDKSVRSVLIPDWDTTSAGCITFAGTFGGGLFKSRHITSDVINETPTNDFKIVRISPQPAYGNAAIIWTNPSVQTADIIIRDQIGREVYSLRGVVYPEGENSFFWNITDDYSSGVYFVEISTSTGTKFGKLIVAGK